MARNHMRWQFGAWDKADHAQTGKDARHLYMVICADESINQAGILTLRPELWADEAAMTDDEVEAALSELERRLFVVIDRRHCQLLVRSFIRNDGVYKQPNVLRSALSCAKTVRSPDIKRCLAAELRRLPEKAPDKTLPSGKVFTHPDPHATADEIDPGDPPGDGAENPSVKGSENPLRNSSANPVSKGSANPSSAASTRRRHAENGEPFGEPSGEGEGEGESLTSRGSQVGVARARTREATPPTPIGGRRNNALCRTHPDDGRGCYRCRDIRLADHPPGYDPRPAAEIPDDEIDVDAWADAPADLVPPVEVEVSDDPGAKRRWFATARAEQRAQRAQQARKRLARYQREHRGAS